VPSRKLVRPSTNQEDRRPEIPPNQRKWIDVVEDEPTTGLGDGVVAKAINGHCMGDTFGSRYGSSIWGQPYPRIMVNCVTREGYSAHKSGNIIISDSGAIFSEEDVSNQFGWGNGLFDEMVEYISDTRMRARDSDPNISNECFFQGKLNLKAWHTTQQKWVIHLGKEFYLADLNQTTYTKVAVISYIEPANGISQFQEDGVNALVQTSSGLYRIIIDEDPPQAYRLNAPVQSVSQRIDSDDDTGEKRSKYHYVSSVAKLARGTNFRNRETKPIPPLIYTESGVNLIDEDRKDWSVVKCDKPITDGVDTYGVLTGVDLAARADPATWVETDGCFWININGLGLQQILCDFTTARAESMVDVADVIENALNKYFPNATCEYLAGNVPYFKITSGKIKGGTVSFATAGTGGTDIATVMGCTAASGAAVTTPALGAQKKIYGLTIPTVENTTEPLWHMTHHVPYRTLDLGFDGRHLDENGVNIVNSPDQLIWNKDLRVAASFFARRINGQIEARFGEFEEADVGCVIEFDNGDRVEITGYVNDKLVNYSVAYYYDDDTDWMAAWIGNGRGARVSQAGDILTRTHGEEFTETDIRRPVFWPDGSQGIMKCYIDKDHMRMWDSTDRNVTGMTWRPTYRNYNDIIDDDRLFSRVSAWECKCRFMEPLARGNMVKFQPGFLLTGVRGGNDINYCQIGPGYKQFMGYHVEAYQKITIEDQVLDLVAFPLRYSALCLATIHTGVTNNAVQYIIPGSRQLISIISNVDKVANVGLSNYGSIQYIAGENGEEDMIRFVTNTLQIRDFNGTALGPDLTTNPQTGDWKMVKAMAGSHPQFTSIFSRLNGYLLWWKERV